MFNKMMLEVLLNNDFIFKKVFLVDGIFKLFVIDFIVVVLVGVLIVVRIKVNGKLINFSFVKLNFVIIKVRMISLIVVWIMCFNFLLIVFS